jgi:hypothetical protein
LEKYAADIIRQRSSKPKFQVHNNALLSAGQNYSLETVRGDHKEWGRFAESAVGAHLINSQKFHPYRLFLVGTNGISFENFLSMNPAELFT